MALLDSTGTLLPPSYEPWYDPNASDEEKEKTRRRRPASPPSSQEGQDSQFAVLCSEKQAKVVAMPSQTRIYKHNITEASFVLRADVVQMAGANCIACFCANGHIMTLRYLHWFPLLVLVSNFKNHNNYLCTSHFMAKIKLSPKKDRCTFKHTAAWQPYTV